MHNTMLDLAKILKRVDNILTLSEIYNIPTLRVIKNSIVDPI